jgi:penicillin-binding protein 2
VRSLLTRDKPSGHFVPEPVQPEERQFASGKIAFLQYLTVAIFLFLVASFWDLQIRNPELYSEQARQNRIKWTRLLAPRGRILDRDGRVIVDNRPTYSVILTRENLKFENLRPIADGLDLDYDDLVDHVRRFRSRPKYEPMIIKEDLTPADLSFIQSHNDPETFPELEILPVQRRLYPQGGLAAHLVGYVGEVSDAQLNTPEFARYDQGAIVGQAGIERQYNDLLMGIDGQRQVLVDSRGRERQLLESTPAKPGKDLQLSIDLDLQVVAELALENGAKDKGAVVAIDPRTGEVLALASRPAYDPNKFASRIRAKDWKELVSNPDNPLLNRAIQAQFAPGSTFKPIVALAGLESGSIDDDFRVHCSGGASFYGRYFKCWRKEGHGGVALHYGIVQSCDVFFYNVGNKTGVDNIAHYAEMAGLGSRTGIDLPNEAPGVVPSTQWKMRTFRQKWYAGETISVAIGQGALTLTPIQLAEAYAGLSMGGVWYKPHLVKGATQPARKAEINLDHLTEVISGMWGVVNEGGTGAAARIPGVDLCGKTGSAQLASNELLKGSSLALTMKDNGWFIGFAPRDNPEIVVSALFESGLHGALAGPIVRDVIKAYFDKKARLAMERAELAIPQLPAPQLLKAKSQELRAAN